MKKLKLKKKLKFYNRAIIFIVFFLWILVWTVFWALYTESEILPDDAELRWSSYSLISFTWTVNREWFYVNKDNDSTIIWNYFKWYYYDSTFWFFKLDWSSNSEENVRVVWSTDKCSWYGYRLGGKAKWTYAWFINFWYDSNTYVYYCLDDWMLHWTAYGEYVWYQDFEWISLEIVPTVEDLIEKVSDDVFVNDDTSIDQIKWTATETSNAGYEQIWWDIFRINDERESIFYIIK